MKMTIVFLLGLLCGAALVWWVAPNRYPYLYQTSRPLTLSHQGRNLGILPEGTPLIADVQLTRTPDLGWWGFAPVLFDDMWRAQDLGIVPWEGDEALWQRITLRADEPSEHHVEPRD